MVKIGLTYTFVQVNKHTHTHALRKTHTHEDIPHTNTHICTEGKQFLSLLIFRHVSHLGTGFTLIYSGGAVCVCAEATIHANVSTRTV